MSSLHLPGRHAHEVRHRDTLLRSWTKYSRRRTSHIGLYSSTSRVCDESLSILPFREHCVHINIVASRAEPLSPATDSTHICLIVQKHASVSHCCLSRYELHHFGRSMIEAILHPSSSLKCVYAHGPRLDIDVLLHHVPAAYARP